MVKNLQKYILSVLFFLCFQISKSENIDDYFQIVRQYQLAYNNSNFKLLDSLTFTQTEYNDLIKKIDKESPNCLTDFDKTFDVNIFEREFQKSHLYHLKSDTIVINNIIDLSSCTDLSIKKLACFVYFKKQQKSFPVSLIVINLSEQKQKILMDIINENYFANEKF